MNKRPPGPQRSLSTPENFSRVTMLRGQSHFARHHAIEWELNDRTVRRILLNDLGIHLYKIVSCKS